jgi:two-component system OmpR family sensor kinase
MTRKWYRSLYWRITIGLVGLLALMLAAEAALFLWVGGRIAGSLPASSPRRLAAIVASDLGAALTANPALDLDQYVADEFGELLQTFVVLMRDGRVAANHELPPDLLALLRREAARRAALAGRRGAAAGRRGGTAPEAESRDAERVPRRLPLRALARAEFAPIIAGGVTVGRVVVGARPSFARTLRQFGPTMAVVAGGVLLVGSGLIALLVFGPARRRLLAVQAATERLGAGDLSARAPDEGGDEVAALARSFNRMADELAARARALEAADRTRRQLLADVSHELMTPLTAMRGYIETLSMPEVQLDAATRERYLKIAMEETHRLERIIGDLLDLARLEDGGASMRRETVDLEALVERVATRHERELDARRIRMTRRVDPAAAFVTGDPDRLEQALQNLASNALRYTPDGGEIIWSAARSGSTVTVTVRDTGPGIPPEHLPYIFNRFHKADGSRKASGGSGLGLAIVKTIVERHGGSITAHNDGGAVFTITLPLVQP